MKKIVYLIDGTSLCYRSFFALNLSNSRGFPTGAIYGFYQTLRKILKTHDPAYIGICFDVARKTFRNEKFKEYKINRPPLPDDLGRQIPLVKEMIRNLGIEIIEKKGFEADDVIAALARKALADKAEVVIVSSDKDLYQLIEEDEACVYNYQKDKFIKRKDFIKEYGFSPVQIIDYLSLAGDASDNVPGAKGIGKVTAQKLIKEFKTVEGLFDNLDKLKPRLRQILETNRDQVFLSKELVTLYSCDLDIAWQDLTRGELKADKLHKMFSELGFKAFLKDIPVQGPDLDLQIKPAPSISHLESLAKKPLALYIRPDKTFIFDHEKNCIYKEDTDKLKVILEDPKIKKISAAFKEQLLSLDKFQIKGLWFDTEIAAYVIDSHLSDYSLMGLISYHLQKQASNIEDQLKPYFIFELYEKLAPLIEKEGVKDLFFEVEMPLISVLSQMQKSGLKVEAKVLDELLAKVDKKIIASKSEIFKVSGREFNLNSPKQLSVVLFEDLKIVPIKKTKTGYSTNEAVLEKLSGDFPIAEHLLVHRRLNKLKNTYILPLTEQVKEEKGILHAQFNQTAAQTGRLSSSSPNLQSIPVKGEFSRDLRKAFLPTFSPGAILAGDYSQIELRILAHLSGDENLIKAFKEDLDIHAFTASLLFGIKEKDVDSLKRNIAKRVNFGIIYGMSNYGLSRELKISPFEAQNFIDDYFSRYKGVKAYIDQAHKQAINEGFVQTIMGRRRKLPDVTSSNPQLREFALRQAMNAPIQGSCADIIKLAMVNISKELDKKKLRSKLIMQIHDELIFDLPAKELDVLAPLVKKHMEEAVKLKVPVKVNLKAGKNWGEAESL